MELQHRFSETRSCNDDGTLALISYSGAAIGDLGATGGDTAPAEQSPLKQTMT